MSLLSVSGLKLQFNLPEGQIQAISGLTFSLEEGETLGIVGESGAGKSQTAFAILGLLPSNASISGSIQFQGQELLGLSRKYLNQIRAKHIGMVFQDPMTALNPYLKIGQQLIEVLQIHEGFSYQAAFNHAIKMLDAVKIPAARQRMSAYPHQMSGGMLQRVVIAMALLCRPKLLIADEPTTALDVTVQAQIMALLKELQQEFNTAIILITHDLGVVAGSCQRLLVMYAGDAVEVGQAEQIFSAPKHPYTQGLLSALPRLDTPDETPLATIPGSPPNLLQRIKGCAFKPRCLYAMKRCEEKPLLRIYEESLGHQDSWLYACHLEGKSPEESK